MDTPRSSWRNTTHDWASTVDPGHLAAVREDAGTFAPGGVRHLVLEVVAYAADEAEWNGRGEGRCVVTLHPDGSVSVADDGRGTDTRLDDRGHVVKKPVMATKDLRFFDHPDAQLLPDGHPRRGMSVVAALSEWLVHTNRRRNGSWTQRYEHGVPVTDLTPVADDGSSGTVVRFRPDESLGAMGGLTPGELIRLVAPWQRLSVTVEDHRPA
ncbi:DNA topoisomerase subunit B [Streptomyces nondiastaticus]|uniref:DNA topoisomerase (ATP-hydrolyzing) n=1 Tax=Streptomyces nondiastaticus TaxID=3154512 RepID=A0ABW6U2P9_9ACTN